MIPVRYFFLLAISAVGVLGGSPCPSRVDIYPCMCINTKLTSRRQAHTTIVCQGLRKTDDLITLLSTLKDLEIDKFVLYDSFWEATQQVGAGGESQSVLPNDWLTLTTIKEMEIVDSTLSACFACQWTLICRNTVTTSFRVKNSTSADKICTICEAGRGNRLPWMGCMVKLEDFQLSHGGLKSLTRDFFPLSMQGLKTLDLSYNQISKIDPSVFRNVPNLKSLDLSHNAIDSLKDVFPQSTQIEYLDLSYNALKTIGRDLVSSMPKIKLFNFAYNQITNLARSDWGREAPGKLHTIDLKGNLIHCDCNMRFLNSTFDVGVHILGTCASPDEFRESRLRPVTKNLIQRCDDRGVLGRRKKKN